MTEILEYALSLAPTVKGSEPFTGLPHLQSFRLVHAYALAELGDSAKAQKYIEAITATMKTAKPSPYFHPFLLAKLRELSERLSGTPILDAAGSWMGRKMNRPTLDGVWGALEGSFAKFIAGDDPASQDLKDRSVSGKGKPLVGPFSHYSAITPDATSGGVSRVQSHADFGAYPQRSPPVSRAGSALDFYSRRAESPAQRASSSLSSRTAPVAAMRALAGRESSEMSTEFNYNGGGYRSFETENAPWGQENNSYGHGSGGYENEVEDGGSLKTPQPTQFFSVQEEEGPYSPVIPAPVPSSSAMPSYAPADDDLDEEDDLGLGNAGKKKAKDSTTDQGANGGTNYGAKAKAEAAKEEKAKQGEFCFRCVCLTCDPRLTAVPFWNQAEVKASASSGWLGRLWGSKKEADGPKAVRAQLGEQSSFYYDKEQKRWVNKKAGDTGPKASTPPPPPRSKPSTPSNATPPPSSEPPSIRASFETNSSGPPPSPGKPGPPVRARSNLADHTQPPAAQAPMRPPSSAAVSNAGTPPPSTGPPRGPGGKKKAVKPRYVVVD